MKLTLIETVVTILMVSFGTMITRFLPFALFSGKKSSNPYIDYLGKVLPYAAIGLIVVYCLKNVNFKESSHGIPEAIAILSIILLHNWRKSTLLSIGGGTAVYMLLVQTVF